MYNITDLPKPREIEEIMKDQDFIDQKNKIMKNQIEEIAENDTEMSESDNEIE